MAEISDWVEFSCGLSVRLIKVWTPLRKLMVK